MAGKNVRPNTREPSRPTAPDKSSECRTCQELHLAEAVANARRDYSRATDCRVLLRRHQAADDCSERGSE
ncbi:hypothetical protein AB0J21_26655 [Streptomyces sp. NPDC049954]|uniref:hypothetical protein n=1 Tax=Streptomyces sp. NPDC049954 TaxID=3155779 RepID=UPI003412C573